MSAGEKSGRASSEIPTLLVGIDVGIASSQFHVSAESFQRSQSPKKKEEKKKARASAAYTNSRARTSAQNSKVGSSALTFSCTITLTWARGKTLKPTPTARCDHFLSQPPNVSCALKTPPASPHRPWRTFISDLFTFITVWLVYHVIASTLKTHLPVLVASLSPMLIMRWPCDPTGARMFKTDTRCSNLVVNFPMNYQITPRVSQPATRLAPFGKSLPI